MKVRELFEKTDPEVEALRDLKDALQHAKQGRGADFRFDRPGELDVRHWGDWQTDHENRDFDEPEDEDDDWQIPTDATKKALHDIIASVEKKHSVKFKIDSGEKNYFYFSVEAKTSK